MAIEDDFDVDWEDPFGGDFDLDMDFDMDPYAKQSFVGGVTSGFLSGIVDETIGSGQARMRTLRTILPSSFSNALDRLSWASERLDDIKEDFKKQNVESVKYLQNIAGKLSTKMEGKLPGAVTGGMSSFSEKDFSSWEPVSSSSEKVPTMEGTEEYDVNYALERSLQQQHGLFSALGDTLNEMSAAVGGMITGSITAGNRQLVGIESSIRTLVDYQRNVQIKMDQSKLDLMARSYVADIKYYKFMEKALHTEIAELKKIVINSNKSDYEKTSHLTASKAYARNRLFSTVGKRVGGFSGLMREKFGKGARDETYNDTNFLLSSIVDMMEMSEDMPMSKGMFGNILGKNLAEGVINNAPYFFERGKGKEWLEKLAKARPEQAAAFKKQYGKLSNKGNQASYLANSIPGIMNILGENWEALDEMPFLDYEDYLESLPEGKKPLSKAVWSVKNTASNKVKGSINQFMSEMTKGKGTQYTLTRRNVKDLNQPGIWKEINNITLNEVIPGLLGRLHQSVEGLRTGEMKGPVSYSYMRGQYMDADQKAVSVQADLMPYSEFSRFASAALEMVDSFDPDKTLSPAARRAFAQAIAKDVDQEKAFTPFIYAGEIPGVDRGHQAEINALMKRHFGIDDTQIQSYQQGNGIAKVKMMMNLGEEGNARLNKAASAAANLKDLFPNVAERIDLLRSTGNEQMLRDLGVIYTENGADKVNMDVFHDRIGRFMESPNDPQLRGMITGSGGKPPPTRSGFGFPPTPSKPSGSGDQIGGTFENLNSSINKLTEALAAFDNRPPQGQGDPALQSLGAFDKIGNTLDGISTHTGKMEALLSTLVTMAEEGKLFQSKTTPGEEQEMERAKSGFMDKIKGMFPSGLMTKGMDLVMKNQPIVFGTLLGALGSHFVQNPILAGATIIGGAMLGGIVQHWGRQDAAASGEAPSDDEDILDENGEVLLSAGKLKAGVYVDAVTKRVIKFWNDIRGPIYDTGAKIVIGVKDLGKKIFGPDGRKVVLQGLTSIKNAAVGAYNFVDPLARIKAIMETGKELMYQQNVYVKGVKTPRLRSIGFKNRDYWIDDNGTFKPIAGWNEINGPVYNDSGDKLISQEEFEEGLITETGQRVRTVGAFGSGAVAGIAGMAKKGFDSIMGRFGFTRQETSGETGDLDRGIGKSQGGVERRLDRIYALLCKQFGKSVDDDELEDTAKNSAAEERLNSLADKARKAKEASQDKTNEAIQDIAEELKGGKEDSPREEKKGFIGKLMGLFGSMGGFMMNLFKNPLGTIGNALLGSVGASAGRLAKIGSMLFSGVLGMGSPIIKLLKWGFTGLGKALAGRSMFSGLSDMFGAGGVGGGRGPRPGGRAGMLSKLPGMGKLLGMGALVGGSAYASGALDNIFPEDPFAEPPETPAYVPQRSQQENAYVSRQDARAKRDGENAEPGFLGNALGFIPQFGMAKFVTDSLGMNTDSAGGKIFSDDGKMFLSKEDRNRYEDERDGVIAPYTMTRDPSKTFSPQKQVRYAQYGLRDIDNELALHIDELEQFLIPYVTIHGNRAGIRDDANVKAMINQFASYAPPQLRDQVETWFRARFKPVFLIYNAGISIARMGDINEFDMNKDYESLQVVERILGTVGLLDPNPMAIQVQISDTISIMNQVQTQMRVNQLVKEMRELYPKPSAKLTLKTSDEARTEALREEPLSTNPFIASVQSFFGSTALRDQQRAIDEKFKSPKEVKAIDISDMHKDAGTEIDPFTFARLMMYGNVDNMPWRVDAVLRLERYCEAQINVLGAKVEYTGAVSRVLELFKPMFRLTSQVGESNFIAWFNARFLPILKRYVQLVMMQRGDKPAKAWKALTDTNKVEIARELTSLRTTDNDREVSIWEVPSAPFDYAKSGTNPQRAEKYLMMLDSRATQARLKEPELEAAKSRPITEQANANNREGNRLRENTNRLFDRVYGTNRQAAAGNVGIQGGGSGMSFRGAGGNNVYGQGSNWAGMGADASQGGGQYDGQWSEGFNPEFMKKAGEDQGVSLPPNEGERLMLNTMLKHGITDKKQLALGLAMTKKETGNYQSTVENTNWSATTLKKYFRNIPDMATAQKVAAMSAPQRAMYVYGRAPKGPTLGNEKPEDGWLYRGRGFFQLTGKDNYKRLESQIGAPVVENPQLVSEDPSIMAESAVLYLKNNKAMMDIGRSGDFNQAVRGINGGNAVPDTDGRRQYYQEYLQKLNNGDINIPVSDVGVDPYASQPDEVPAAADKDVPKDKISGDNPSSKAAVEDVLAAGDTASKAKVPTPPKSGPGNTASAPIRTQAEKVKAATPTPPASLARPTPAPAAKSPASMPPPVPQGPVSAKLELPAGPLKVQDEGMAQAMAALATSMDNLSRKMTSSANPGNSIRTS
jgi:predicted chitinase